MVVNMEMKLIYVVLVLFYQVSVLVCDFNFEELHSLHYGIDIMDTPLRREDPVPPDAVVLSSKYGQLYQCLYQSPATPLNGSSESVQPANLSVVELLEPLRQLPCLINNKGWWTYEFCYGREIKQYHADDGKIIGDVLSLGLFEQDVVTTASGNERPKPDMLRGRQKSLEQRYHRQLYVNGSYCELTGKLRATEVRFICQEGHGDFVFSIDEHETCSYVIIIHTSRICSHPLYGPMTTTQSVAISCFPLLTSADYDQYMNDRKVEEDAKLKLSDSAAIGTIGDADTSDDLSSDNSPARTTDHSSADSSEGSTESLEKLLLDSLVSGMREAMGEQQGGQGADGSVDIKVVDDDSADLDSLLKSMLQNKPDDEDSVVDLAATAAADSSDAVDPNAATASNEKSFQHQDQEASSDQKAAEDAVEEDGKDGPAADVVVDDDDDDESLADMDEEDREFLREFDKGLEKIAETAAEKARVAKYKDSIQSAVSAMIPDLVQEGQADMARQGDDIAIDAQVAFRKLAKTLNTLIARLENAAKDFDDEETTSQSEKSGSTKKPKNTASTERRDDDASSNVVDAEKVDEVEKKAAVDEAKAEPDDKAQTSSVSDKPNHQLINKLKDQLEQAGLKTEGRKIEFRIISAGYFDKKNSDDDDDGSSLNKMVIAIIGNSDDDETKEIERSRRMEDNYQFKYTRSSSSGQRGSDQQSDEQQKTDHESSKPLV